MLFRFYFGDYNVLSDNPAEYNYIANGELKCLALPKYKFLQVINKYPKIKSKMKSSAFTYKTEMQKHMVRF